MILGDILGAEVTDAQGQRLGVVSDARFVLDGGPDTLLAAPRLLGIIVSPRTSSSFLGFERQQLTSPWPIAQIMRRWHRGSFLVLWADIARMGPDGVGLRDGYTAYAADLPV